MSIANEALSKDESPVKTPEGDLYVISAPSGAGKTTLVDALVNSCEGLAVAVSHTTRARREYEVYGQHYHFVSDHNFERMVQNGEFLEFAQVFQHSYGTTKAEVVRRKQQGQDVVLEIDWQGAHQIRKQLPCVGIFILPPSFDALRQRLSSRGDPSQADVEGRLRQARSDILQYRYFDYLVCNDDFERALADLQAIVRSRRLRSTKHDAQSPLLVDLIST